jgi:hypothetical protein
MGHYEFMKGEKSYVCARVFNLRILSVQVIKSLKMYLGQTQYVLMGTYQNNRTKKITEVK